MRKTIKIICTYLIFISISHAQTRTVEGQVFDAETMQELKNVKVFLLEKLTETDAEGFFIFENIEKGDYHLKIEFTGYESQKIKISVREKGIDLGQIFMYSSLQPNNESGIIFLTEDELSDEGGADNITGLLNASRDVFLNAAAFNFGQSWFRIRGFDSENGTVLINGISMNKIYGGRPQWSNWGGLNDAVRNQEFSNATQPNSYAFGGVLGTTSISTKASEYRPGTKFTVSGSNRNYVARTMITHASGLQNKWAYTFSASRRFATQGYFKGSFYDANSLFASVEYLPNANHSLNFTAIYAYNRRGKSSANTNEVYGIKGTTYNSYWGYQDGKKRNSRVKELEEPIVMLSHQWVINPKVELHSTISYQFGKVGNSRLGYFNAPNPDPTYYRYLPSYYLRDFKNAELGNKVENRFKTDANYSQINWENLYSVNKEYGTSRYYLYEDRNDDKQLSFNTVATFNFNNQIEVNIGGTYQNLKSNNFAKMLDLLGGTHFEDIDQYTLTKNNLNGNSIVAKNNTFLYNYQLFAEIYHLFAQAKFNYKKIDFYLATRLSSVNYQRNGLFKKELYKNNSFGKGKRLSFTNNISAKLGGTYKITGRHFVDANIAYVTKAPNLRNTYPNARVNHDITLGIDTEKIHTGDISYRMRLQNLKARATAYYALFENGTNIARYFNQSLGDFISEITTGVQKKHLGTELSLEYQITSEIKAIAVGAFGKYIYSNNPKTYYTSDEIPLKEAKPITSYLKGYSLSGTPQQALSLGLEYRSPNYWWIGANVNHLSNTYINISPGLRTDQFYINPKTNQPFDGITQQDVDKLLQQEKFNPYTLVNIMGGKSWRIKKKYIGVFATVNNIFNVKYKTNGYEQSRNGNYQLLSEDQLRKKPVFGSKYWYGYGTTFFINAYISF